MADLAQIFLLPPPVPVQHRIPVHGRDQELAVNPDAQGGDATRAKRFRFRVHEGGESSGTGTDLTASRSERRAAASDDVAGNATADQSAPRFRYAAQGDSRNGPSSAFVTQAFAQEQLGEGLHNPPFAAATAAYTRTGAALNPPASAGIDIRA